MADLEIVKKIEKLDNDLKGELLNYIDFLLEKKQKKKMKHPKAGFLKSNSFHIKEGFEDIPECFEEYLS